MRNAILSSDFHLTIYIRGKKQKEKKREQPPAKTTKKDTGNQMLNHQIVSDIESVLLALHMINCGNCIPLIPFRSFCNF